MFKAGNPRYVTRSHATPHNSQDPARKSMRRGWGYQPPLAPVPGATPWPPLRLHVLTVGNILRTHVSSTHSPCAGTVGPTSHPTPDRRERLARLRPRGLVPAGGRPTHGVAAASRPRVPSNASYHRGQLRGANAKTPRHNFRGGIRVPPLTSPLPQPRCHGFHCGKSPVPQVCWPRLHETVFVVQWTCQYVPAPHRRSLWHNANW